MEKRLLCVSFFFIFPILVSSSHGHFLHSRRPHAHRKPPLSTFAQSESPSSTAGPEVFFEVSRPPGGSSSPCSALILQHAFAYTYDLPPAVANYTPPSHCGTLWDQIVLKWSGTCKGRQYDRIAAVWFGGIEILRTCTAEPTSTGIYWEVRKDVTRFASVFKSPQLVVLELANVVDSTYTGIFNINITLEFYTSRRHRSHGADHRHLDHDDGRHITNSWSAGLESGKHSDHADVDSRASIIDGLVYNKHFDTLLHADSSPAADMDVGSLRKHDLQRDRGTYLHAGEMYGHDVQKEPRKIADDGFYKDSRPIDLTNVLPPLEFPVRSPADLVIPISKLDGFSGGHWFDLATENDTASASFSPPRNIIRAVLEICVSFHGTDEFWYTNPPNDYLEANGLSGYPGNGPFREVQVFLDDVLVGAVFPFPVIFTGGINPLFWRPAAAIGAYNLPSYDVELTPFVGSLVDGNNHTISMRVTNADGSWPLDANLHLWLDPYMSQTMGGVLTHNAPTSISITASDFEGLDGTFHTSAARSIAFSGYIISSLGTILASVSYTYAFDNVLVFQNSSSVEIVTQEIQTKGEVTMRTPAKVVFSQETTSDYPFYLSCLDYSGANSAYTEECNLTHSFNQDIFTIASSASTFESLGNMQTAEGSMTVVGSSVTAGVGALQQHYDFQSTQGCYDRYLRTRNYSTLYDITNMSCEHYRADR